MRSGEKTLITLVFNLSELAKDNRSTLRVLVLTTVFWACWSLTTFTGIGLAHMMSMMSCLNGCSLGDRWKSGITTQWSGQYQDSGALLKYFTAAHFRRYLAPHTALTLADEGDRPVREDHQAIG